MFRLLPVSLLSRLSVQCNFFHANNLWPFGKARTTAVVFGRQGVVERFGNDSGMKSCNDEGRRGTKRPERYVLLKQSVQLAEFDVVLAPKIRVIVKTYVCPASFLNLKL
jgi:hypothetical protein